MRLTEMQEYSTPSYEQITEFKGINRNSVIDDGEMRAMHNLSSDRYPCLYQREPRGLLSNTYTDPTLLHNKNNKLAVIDGTQFFYDGVKKMDLNATQPKHMVSINKKICVFPDKLYYDIATDTSGTIDYSYTATAGTATVNIVTLNQDSIVFTGANVTGFKTGDIVKITGAVTATSINNKEILVKDVVHAGSNTSIMFTGASLGADDAQISEAGALKLSRESYDIDYVMESGNRLWGCNSSENCIYASKLGDPTNWRYHQTTSLDSYAAEVGSDGNFTGVAAYSGHLLFFKEGTIHRLYGTLPSNFQLNEVKGYGLQEGCERSVAIINDTVFYKASVGIMAYSGSVPELITSKFGNQMAYTSAVGGATQEKYYVSMKDTSNKWHMYVFDVNYKLWHEEDDTHALSFAYCNGQLYYIDDKDKNIYNVVGADTEKMFWEAQFGPFDEYVEKKKIYSKIYIRLNMSALSTLSISIKNEKMSDWQEVRHIYAEDDRAETVAIIPNRCNKFSIRLEGTGYTEIESITRRYRAGSDKT